jgi:hypothetical protein
MGNIIQNSSHHKYYKMSSSVGCQGRSSEARHLQELLEANDIESMAYVAILIYVSEKDVTQLVPMYGHMFPVDFFIWRL